MPFWLVYLGHLVTLPILRVSSCEHQPLDVNSPGPRTLRSTVVQPEVLRYLLEAVVPFSFFANPVGVCRVSVGLLDAHREGHSSRRHQTSYRTTDSFQLPPGSVIERACT